MDLFSLFIFAGKRSARACTAQRVSPAERRGSFSACNSEKSAEGHTPACGIPPLNGSKKLQPRSTPLPATPGPFNWGLQKLRHNPEPNISMAKILNEEQFFPT